MRKKRVVTEKNAGRISVSMVLPFEYRFQSSQSGEPQELILLLHGYEESGQRILRKLQAVLGGRYGSSVKFD